LRYDTFFYAANTVQANPNGCQGSENGAKIINIKHPGLKIMIEGAGRV
jgi:hypothetical protein